MSLHNVFNRLYGRPGILLAAIMAALVLAALFWPRFSFDASADTLVVEGDPEFAYYREITQRLGGDEFLILTYQPLPGAWETDAESDRNRLFSRPVLDHIGRLQAELAALSGIASVFSILDAPLLARPGIEIADLADDIVTVADPEVDLDAAAEELTTSPIFADLLVSRDGSSTALRIDLATDATLERLYDRRNALRAGRNGETARAELRQAEAEYNRARKAFLADRDRLIENVRALRDTHSNVAELHLGGVPMIAADMIYYVRSDVAVFGTGVGLMVLVMLWLFFRRVRWIALPIATSGITIGLMVGWLGLIGQPVTVISSNFMALLAIITISLTIHLIVRYRELLALTPEREHAALVVETMASKFAPCLYTALTTMVAFASLLTSRIVPVEDFGLMMCIGVLVSLVVTYSFFPATLLLIGPGKPDARLDRTLSFTQLLSRTARHHHRAVIGGAAAVVAMAAVGILQISLENRFIDYFKEDTEIRRGMIYIDQHLGGTVPFDVIVRFRPYEDEELDPDDDFFFEAEEEDEYPERYWFTPDKIATVGALQAYLARQPQVGTLTSVADLEAVARQFNDGRALDALELAVVLEAVPDDIRQEMIEPYASPRTGELRINGRIQESGPYIDREAFLAGIRDHAVNELGLAPEDVRVTGMLVLFHDTLQQLFGSQTRTLGYVVAATLLMFLILLRSLTLAVLGVAPIMLAAGTVLAVMGYAGIPLDMMTITIAAISIGIGVDNAIHYLHRYRTEVAAGHGAREAVRRAHATIGSAIYFTGITIITGFSLLAFSNFVPAIYFGLLTALAMALAMFANLTLLPSLLIGVYGRSEPEAAHGEG